MSKGQARGPARSDRPPNHAGRQAEIVRITDGPPQRWVILTARVLGVMTHFKLGKTTFCAGADCEVSHAINPPRWQGWLGVQSRQSGAVKFLALTPGAVNHCPKLVDREHSLRGLVAYCYRTNGSKTASVRCDLVTIGCELPNLNTLPVAPDVALFLKRLWGLSEEQASELREAYLDPSTVIFADKDDQGIPEPAPHPDDPEPLETEPLGSPSRNGEHHARS